MAKPVKTLSLQKANKKEPLRFAHPFVTTVLVANRSIIPGVGNRMTDYIKTKLEPIPKPNREPAMALADIIGLPGVSEIEKTGFISFHSTGDTGNAVSPMPELIAMAMAADYNIAKPATSPAFFLHLGDVDYYDNTDKGYHAQFYTPYKNYPGKIIAIPGNHDGELFKWDGSSSGQTTTLEAFQRNFCQSLPGVPPAAGTIYREMISQPAVYFVLNAPFVDIIGLYSNVAENPGYISGPDIGSAQKDWLVTTLGSIQNSRKKGVSKALIIAVHHPPIAAAGGHSSSTEMLADIDDACNKAGIMPDAVLAAHAHNYQRFTRTVSFQTKKMQVPFIVCGSGGRGIVSVAKADGKPNGDHVYNKSLMDYGYLLITVTPKLLTIQFNQVDKNGGKKIFDTVTVDLNAHTAK
jgi:hypothetical protein